MIFRRRRLARADRARVGFSQLRAQTSQQWQVVFAGDPAEAAHWLEAAARYGMVEAQTALGQILLDGKGVARDAAAGAGWFGIAAGAGYPPALNMLGRCCERGWGMAVDLPRAAANYQLAAAAGLDWGQYNLANLLLRGRGVPRDRPAALALYRRAAAQGHAKSINMLGRFLEEGWEMPADARNAAICYRRAAESGDFRGQYNLASLLAAHGEVSAAVTWLRRALDLAPPDFLALMAERLSTSDVAAFRAIGALASRRCLTLGGMRAGNPPALPTQG